MKNDNAIISEIFFGIDSHGFMTCNLAVEGEDWGCGFGGWNLGGETGAGIYAMRKILTTFGVNNIDDLRDLPVRVQWNEDRTYPKSIAAIGHIVKNKWFSWKDAFDEYEKENKNG